MFSLKYIITLQPQSVLPHNFVSDLLWRLLGLHDASWLVVEVLDKYTLGLGGSSLTHYAASKGNGWNLML